MTMHTHKHTGRFSEGMEQVPPAPSSNHVGSFADGMAMTAIARVASFADGLALHAEAPAARRIGSFGDVQPRRRTMRSRRGVGVARGGPRPQPA